METDVLGVVLAGGRSSRMGTDKAAIEFDGALLVERAVSELLNVFAEVVVAGASSVTPTVEMLPDVIRGRGPLSGLDAAYAHASGRAIFLLALDMPFVDAATVRSLINPRPDDMGANIAISDGTLQPLCGSYGSGLAGIVRQHLDSDDRSMARLIAGLETVRRVAIEPTSAMNINAVSDLEAAERERDQRNGSSH